MTEYQLRPRMWLVEKRWRHVSKDNAVMKATKQHQAQELSHCVSEVLKRSQKISKERSRSVRLTPTLRRPHPCRRRAPSARVRTC